MSEYGDAVGPTANPGPSPVHQLPGFVDIVEVARGGDSTIYRARQTALDREVAIKVLNLSDADDVRRFQREIELTVRLGRQHPNIVNVLDTRALSDGRPAIVMDFYELGSTYDRLRATGPFSAQDVVRMGLVIADAVGFAHSHGVVHRDVKPQNILILPTSYVLADFGIARMIDTGHTTSLERLSYRHASPEVLDGRSPEVEDDLWSLGSSLFMLLEGRAPFAADDADEDTALAYLRRVRMGERRPFPADTPAALRQVIDKAMAPDRSARYRDAKDLIADLQVVERDFSAWAPAPAAEVPTIANVETPVSPRPVEPAADDAPTSAAPEPPAVSAPTINEAAATPESPAVSEPTTRAATAAAAPAVSEPIANAAPTADNVEPTQNTAPADLSPQDAAFAPEPIQPAVTRRTEVASDDLAWSPDPQAPVPPPVEQRPSGADSAMGLSPSIAPALLGADTTTDPDAAPTGLHPEPPAEVAKPAEPASATTSPKVRGRIIAAAVAMLVLSCVVAYLILRPTEDPTALGPPASQTSTAAEATEAGSGIDVNDPDYAPFLVSAVLEGDQLTVTFKRPKAEATVLLVEIKTVDGTTSGETLETQTNPEQLEISAPVSLQVDEICVALVGLSTNDGSTKGLSEQRCVSRSG